MSAGVLKCWVPFFPCSLLWTSSFLHKLKAPSHLETWHYYIFVIPFEKLFIAEENAAPEPLELDWI